MSDFTAVFDALTAKIKPYVPDPKNPPDDLPESFLKEFTEKIKMSDVLLPKVENLKETLSLQWKRKPDNTLDWYTNEQGGKRFFRGGFPYVAMRRSILFENGSNKNVADDFNTALRLLVYKYHQNENQKVLRRKRELIKMVKDFEFNLEKPKKKLRETFDYEGEKNTIAGRISEIEDKETQTDDSHGSSNFGKDGSSGGLKTLCQVAHDIIEEGLRQHESLKNSDEVQRAYSKFLEKQGEETALNLYEAMVQADGPEEVTEVAQFLARHLCTNIEHKASNSNSANNSAKGRRVKRNQAPGDTPQNRQGSSGSAMDGVLC